MEQERGLYNMFTFILYISTYVNKHGLCHVNVFMHILIWLYCFKDFMQKPRCSKILFQTFLTLAK